MSLSNSCAVNQTKAVYIGDVPVEATFHGSTLLHRLFAFNQENCTIIELGKESGKEARLKLASYKFEKYNGQALRMTSLRALGRWLEFLSKNMLVRKLAPYCDDSDAIVTVADGFGWYIGDLVSRLTGIPLHLIVHDYPLTKIRAPRGLKKKLQSEFLRVYAHAASRLCVSPYMEQHFREICGVKGNVLLPGRSQQVSAFPYQPPRSREGNDFTIGFFGTLYSKSSLEMLNRLVASIRDVFGNTATVNIYGTPLEDRLRSEIQHSDSINFCGYIPSVELVQRLGSELDALFLPIPFDSNQLNMTLHFPSKLTDYTATGLPIVVHGPPNSSAVKWCSQFPEAFLISDSADSLGDALHKLKDFTSCSQRGQQSYLVGKNHFDFHKIGGEFWESISKSSRR